MTLLALRKIVFCFSWYGHDGLNGMDSFNIGIVWIVLIHMVWIVLITECSCILFSILFHFSCFQL